MQEFVHEKLDVYKAALTFLAAADEILEEVPRGRGHLVTSSIEQRHRSCSVLPEGAFELRPPSTVASLGAHRMVITCGHEDEM